MKESKARYYLKKLKLKYLLLRLAEVLLLTLGAVLLVYSICELTHLKSPVSVLLSLGTGLIVFMARFFSLRLNQLQEKQFIRYIHDRYPQLEDSADLLLKEADSLTRLEKIQQLKIDKQFNAVYPTITLPHYLIQASLVFVFCVVISIGLSSFHIKSKPDEEATEKHKEEIEQLAIVPASVKRIRITVTPPSYTGLAVDTSTNPKRKIPEGSKVRWHLQFTRKVLDPHLVFSRGDTLPLSERNDEYTNQRSFTQSDFYQLRWTDTGGETKSSDYYPIEIIKDKAPEVTIKNLAQFTQLNLHDKLTVDIKTTLSDDYGLKDAYIIATVSKGSGESVKFREEKLFFASPSSIQGKNVQASRTIDLMKLMMEPGDELYFYAEAIDTKIPAPNRSRTETYFIALQDTAKDNISVEAGLGVDLMPEYFRSQRQIIIDTEKLLKEKKQITRQRFNEKSNTLGYDQKVLRLKYGEFLGEEFESGIIQPETEDNDDHDQEDVTKKFGHVHDKENEDNRVGEKKTEDHEHSPKSSAPDKKENPLEAFVHTHDDEEEATFFIQSIRAKLKAALTIMWDAELYLRLYEPDKSLPYQYKALKLLKEISNDSRIYVHRTGFDPPPIKEDKRFTGDLNELKNTTAEIKALSVPVYPGIREALHVTEQFLSEEKPRLSTRTKTILLQAGNELSILALEKPGQFLNTLSLIKALTQDEIETQNINAAVLEIRKTFWNILPKETDTPTPSTQAAHPLDEAFIKNLKALKQ